MFICFTKVTKISSDLDHLEEVKDPFIVQPGRVHHGAAHKPASLSLHRYWLIPIISIYRKISKDFQLLEPYNGSIKGVSNPLRLYLFLFKDNYLLEWGLKLCIFSRAEFLVLTVRTARSGGC